MKQAQFRFHAELNDFLAPKVKGATITCPINGDQSVKHLIESLGIPHPEVSRILVNEIPLGLSKLTGNMPKGILKPSN